MIVFLRQGNDSNVTRHLTVKNDSSLLLMAKNAEHVIIFGRQVQSGLLNIVTGLFW